MFIAGIDYKPPATESLPDIFHHTVKSVSETPNVIDRAITVFLTCAKFQFSIDCNKRIGQLLMNSLL